MNLRNCRVPLTVQTPEGPIQLPVLHIAADKNDQSMRVKISANIQGQAVVFEADTTEEALERMAKHLPGGWNIKSCLTCKHGHFCPVGDEDNELFCIADFEAKEACDLWNATENEKERAERRRTLFDLCGQYAPLARDFYTYR